MAGAFPPAGLRQLLDFHNANAAITQYRRLEATLLHQVWPAVLTVLMGVLSAKTDDAAAPGYVNVFVFVSTVVVTVCAVSWGLWDNCQRLLDSVKGQRAAYQAAQIIQEGAKGAAKQLFEKYPTLSIRYAGVIGKDELRTLEESRRGAGCFWLVVNGAVFPMAVLLVGSTLKFCRTWRGAWIPTVLLLFAVIVNTVVERIRIYKLRRGAKQAGQP